MSLKSLLKEVSNWVPFDEDAGVYFNLNFLHKSVIKKINAMNTKKTFNKRTRQPEEELDVEGFKREMFEKSVVGWKGVTYNWLSKQVPLELDKIEDPDAEIPFSQQNLCDVAEMVSNLDIWLLDSVQEGSNFQAIKDEDDLKN
jgi:hypothetical protein